MPKRIAYALIFSLLLLGARARAGGPPAPDIGVDEKLGQNVPRDITLVDEQGERVTLDKLLGQPTILTLNYFRCTGLCTPLLNGVADMMKRIDQQPGKDFRVLTVSFDPRDDAELAQHKRDNYVRQLGPKFPPSTWRFLTGDPGSTKRLADSVGFKFAKVDDNYVHPGVIMVLSPSGKVTRYLYGVTFSPFDVKMALLQAAEGNTMPTINRLVSLCYSYDPVGRTYLFNITRVVGAFTLVLAGIFVAVLLVRGRRPRDEPASPTGAGALP
jgi:protein SCO1/2